LSKNSPTNEFVHWFRQAGPYIHAHRGRCFVLLIGGETVQSPGFTHLIHDIALLNALGIKLVLVHGARPQIETRLSEAGLNSQIVENLRVTEADSLPIISQSIGQVRYEIEALLSTGLINTPMAGASIRVTSGNLISAQPLGVHHGVDFGHTGVVRKIDVDYIQHHLSQHAIVLLSPLGYSRTGETFVLSAEEVAMRTAIQLKADKLICLCEGQGIMGGDDELFHELSLSQAQQLLAQQPHNPYLEAAVTAVQQGVKRVHIVSNEVDGGLLQELFSRNGLGTLISAENYDQIRTATIDDIGGILELIGPLEQKGVLVRRSREYLEMEINHFTVMERDGMILGCAASYHYANDKIAELACVAIHADYQKQGRGDALLHTVEQNALKHGIEKLFVLTTQTAHWFIERGFVEANIDALPMEKQSLYNFQRRSKVFIKTIK